MRILFVCAGLDQHGGFENEVEATVRVALNAGHRTRVYTPYMVRTDATVRRNLGDRVPFDSAQERWRHTYVGRLAVAGSATRMLLRTRRRPTAAEDIHLARRVMRAQWDHAAWEREAERIVQECDVVHVFGKPKIFMAQAASAAHTLGIPSVYEEVNQVTQEYVDRYDHRQFSSLAHAFDVMIARCQQQVSDMRRRYRFDGPIEIIEQWAYDCEEPLLAITRSTPDPAAETTFGTLSRLAPEKRLDVLLRAFAAARRNGARARLRIAGSGPLDAELRELASNLRLHDATEFVGYVGANKPAFYASLDVFVIASRQEGGPVTGVEAMAAALPIISTPVGAMPERLRDDGLFCEVGNVDELAEAIVRLASSSSLRERLGHAARRRYLARHRAALCGTQKIELWQDLSSSRRQVSASSR
jgi:glycosyltransferase involved in cell wall biosynthesis